MVVIASSGLMSRCYTLADAYALLKASNSKEKKLIILWPWENGCAIPFYKAFSRDFLKDDEIEIKVIEKDIRSAPAIRKNGLEYEIQKKHFITVLKEYKRRKILNSFIHKNDFAALYENGSTFIDYTPPSNVGWEGEKYRSYTVDVWRRVKEIVDAGDLKFAVSAYCGIIHENDRVNYPKYSLQNIQFNEEMIHRAEVIVPDDGRRWIGVHIRRTDHQVCIDFSPTELFIDRMKAFIAEDSSTVFFLATDDKEEENRLKDEFPGKIVTQDCKVWGRDNQDAMLSGIVDCLCLSRCDAIIGSYSSIFSHFAAEYGNKKIEYVMNKEDKR